LILITSYARKSYKQLTSMPLVKLILCVTKYKTRSCIPCLIKHHAMKTCGGEELHALTSTPDRWVVSFTARPFCPRGKSPWYPFH